jgi:hypothetical protein
LQMAHKCLPSSGAVGQEHLLPTLHWGISLLCWVFLLIWLFKKYVHDAVQTCSWHGQNTWHMMRPVLVQSSPYHEHAFVHEQQTPFQLFMNSWCSRFWLAGNKKTATFWLNMIEWHGQDAFNPLIRPALRLVD